MSSLSEYLYIASALLIALQAYVSLRVAAYDGYTTSQKFAQILIVWLIPMFGALLVYSFLAADQSTPKKRDTAFTPDGGGNPEGINESP